MTDALSVTGASKSFGGFRALKNVDLDVAEGSIHGLIGTNGAGKTTLLKVITGHEVADKGKLTAFGVEITKMPTWRRIRLGIGQSFQVASVFDGMTVRENIEIAAAVGTRRAIFQLLLPATAEQRDSFDRAVDATQLQDLLQTRTANLSHGDRKRLEIALVVAQSPKLLLLDEPTAGMSKRETDTITELLDSMRKAMGLTMVVVEHDMDVVFNLVDRVTVLHQGEIAFDGTPKEVTTSELVRDIYLGTDIALGLEEG